MNNLNSIILEGNIVRDAVLSEPAPGFTKCGFSMGVNRYYKSLKNEDKNEVSFFDVEAYGKLAEYCEMKATKGRGVRVVGRLKQDVWKDSSGKNVSKVYVVAEHIEYKPVKKTQEDAVAAAEPKVEPTETPAAESGSATAEKEQVAVTVGAAESEAAEVVF